MITISQEDPSHPEVAALLAASDAHAASLYPAASSHMLDSLALGRSGVTLLVARDTGRAVGCVALVRSEIGWAEIKRLFVMPFARGRGLGRRLAEAVEKEAEGLTLRLETGVRQPEAIALYESLGFVRIEPFGDYRPDPLSVYMEKRGSVPERRFW